MANNSVDSITEQLKALDLEHKEDLKALISKQKKERRNLLCQLKTPSLPKPKQPITPKVLSHSKRPFH